MVIADRLRALREAKNLSQGDVEKRTGLLRCYISRVENGHTVPAIETLEKLARAMEVPLYQLFYDGEEPPAPPSLAKRKGRTRRRGGAREKTGESLIAFVACCGVLTNRTGNYCFTWRRKWRGQLGLD